MFKMQKIQLLFIVTFILLNHLDFISASGIEDDSNTSNSTENLNDTDSVPQDLYVIKTVVYEIGILTNAGNDTDKLNETHEQVDVSFFDPAHNGSLIDLSNIPVPIQTNISGVSVTGILPANLGSLTLPSSGLTPPNASFPVLPNQQITVTQNISTDNPDKGSEIISNLPKILGLSQHKSKESEPANKTSTEKI